MVLRLRQHNIGYTADGFYSYSVDIAVVPLRLQQLPRYKSSMSLL